MVVGLVSILLGSWGLVSWWNEFGALLRGLVPLGLVVLGIAAIGTAFQAQGSTTEEQEQE